MKIHSENFIAEINIDLSNNLEFWGGMGTLDKKIDLGEYSTNIGKILILDIREDLTFSFVVIEKAITWSDK